MYFITCICWLTYWQNLILYSSMHVEDTLVPFFSFSFWRGTILVTIMNVPTHPASKKASRTWFDSGPEVRNHYSYYPVTWGRVLIQRQSHNYSKNCFMWKPKVHYHIHMSPRPIHLNSAHTLLSWFFNIILPSTLKFFKRSRFFTRIFVHYFWWFPCSLYLSLFLRSSIWSSQHTWLFLCCLFAEDYATKYEDSRYVILTRLPLLLVT